MHGYVGEWNSNSAGSSVTPSNQDNQTLEVVCKGMRVHGQPGLLLVIGEREQIEVWRRRERIGYVDDLPAIVMAS